MQRASDRLDWQENRTQWKWTAGIAAAFGAIMFALITLTWNSPNWVSDATQAEFVGTMTPDRLYNRPGNFKPLEPIKRFRTMASA